MRTTITSADLLAILEKMATDMEAPEGLPLRAGRRHGRRGSGRHHGHRVRGHPEGPGLPEDQDIGTIITKSGLTFNGTAASTIGALLATACMRAGREAKGKHEIGLADVATMLAAAQIGIQERGKAQVGDKTVLDALAPTAAALKAAAAAGLPLPEALRRSLAAAEAGLQGHHPDEVEDGARRLDRRAQRGPPGSRRHVVLPDVEVGGGVSDGVRHNGPPGVAAPSAGGCIGRVVFWPSTRHTSCLSLGVNRRTWSSTLNTIPTPGSPVPDRCPPGRRGQAWPRPADPTRGG